MLSILLVRCFRPLLRRYFLCLGLLLGSQPLAAQVFAVDLPTLPASRIPRLPFRVGMVVDARANRTMLGTVKQGLDNRWVPASFRHTLQTDLLAFLQPLPAAADAPVVVLRIHSLTIAEEVRASTEWASAELQADFLVQQGTRYRPLQAVSTAAESDGLDVTGNHGSNLVEALTKALLQLAVHPELAAPAADTATLSWNDVLAGHGYRPYRFPIQQTRTPRRGIYRTLQEFQADAPGVANRPFQVLTQARPEYKEKWGTQPEIDAQYLTQNNAGQRQPVRGVWGLSDGTSLYIFQRGEYFQLTPTTDGYSFTGVEAPSPTEMTTATVVGGGGGMTVMSSLANGPADYELNVTTGLLRRLNDKASAFANAAPDSAAVYLYYRTTTKDAGAAATVTVDGRLAGSLGPNRYVPLAWRDLRREMTICVGETCYSFLPVPGTITYLAYQKAAAPATIKPVAVKEGIFQLKHIRAREKKPGN